MDDQPITRDELDERRQLKELEKEMVIGIEHQANSYFTNRQGVSMPLTGIDPVVELMQELGIPLTKQNWLEFNYPDGVPDPLPPELEIPPEVST